jgi:hypothetical protein
MPTECSASLFDFAPVEGHQGHWLVNALWNSMGRLVGCRDYPAHEGTHVSCRQIRNASARARR